MKANKPFNKSANYLPIFLKDIKLLKWNTLSAKAIGICPFGAESLNLLPVSKLYVCLVFSMLIIFSIWVGIVRIKNDKYSFTVIENFFNIAERFTGCAIYVSLLNSNIKKINSWNTFFQSISEFDQNVQTMVKFDERKIWDVIGFILLHIGPPCYSIIDLTLWAAEDLNSGANSVLYYVPQHIGITYEYNIAAFFWEMSSVLRSRYVFLKKQLERTILNINENLNRTEFKHNIKRIKTNYKLLQQAVTAFNRLFNFVILFVLIHVQAMFITNIYWVFFLVPIHRTDIIIEGLLGYPTFISVS